MKKTILSVAAVFAALAVNAQMAQVSTPEPILKGVESDMYHPVLSADGQHLLFSGIDYTNLRTYDFASGSVQKITANPNEALVAHFDNADKVALAPRTNVRTQGSTLYICVNGQEKAYTPVEAQAGYLWESLSPDGKKVMFVAAGKGIVITDLNGNILSRPGNFEAPVWFGNDHIIAQNSTDDGHQYSSSQIVLIKADGSETQAITKPESMTFAPAASAEANKVVYSTIDGRMYQVNVTLK